MIMVVQCKCCMTEYRLDEALLKGAKGALIRCPNCLKRFFVENPQAPPVSPLRTSRVAPPVESPNAPPKVSPPAPPAAVETDIPPIRVESPGGMTSPAPGDRRAEADDLPDVIRPDPVVSIDDEIDVSPTTNAISASIISRGKAPRVEEIFIHPSAVEGDWIPGGGDDGPIVTRSPGPGWNPPRRRPLYRRPLFFAAMVSIPLLAGAVFYLVDGNFGGKSSGSPTPGRARSAPENALIDVGNLKGYLNKKASGETLYLVKGTVTNVGKALSSGIRIEATLVGKDNQAIVKNGTFAGNVIDDSLISHMNRDRIENILGIRYGDGDVNRDIPAGKTLTFMVVFFDPPEGVESFRVKAVDAQEYDRIDSPDGKEPDTRAWNQPSIRSKSVAAPN